MPQTAESQRDWRKINPGKTREYYERQRLLHPGKAAEQHREWSKNHPEKILEKKRKAWREHPEKIKAQNAVHYAIRVGKLVRPTKCSKCCIECKPHGHHYRGYAFKLDVVWLCVMCHAAEHRPHRD